VSRAGGGEPGGPGGRWALGPAVGEPGGG